MQETYLTRAIILNRFDFRENDSRVVLYSVESGRIDLVARGAKKITSKLSSHLEPLNLVSIMAARGKQFDYVGSAVSEKCYQGIKTNYEKMILAGKAIGVIGKLLRSGERDEKIFGLLKQYLDCLEEKDLARDFKNGQKGGGLLFYFFVFRLLVELGYKPELRQCVVCKNKIDSDSNSFSFLSGGLVCAKCKNMPKGDKISISNDCIKVLRYTGDNDWGDILKLDIKKILAKEIALVINIYLKHILNR